MDRNAIMLYDTSVLMVALRKESVDRNDFPVVPVELTTVALRKESVDRNVGLSALAPEENSRSPQGERG